MFGDRTLMMVNGPARFEVNFGLVMEHFRFLTFSQTLSPLVKGVNPWLLHKDMTWQVSL